MKDKELIEHLLDLAGIKIGGDNPWDIQIKDERFYRRVVSQGSLGLGESYMDGWWDCPRLDELVFKVTMSGVRSRVRPTLPLLFLVLKTKLFNMQSIGRSPEVAEKHYNLGNKLYENFLDPYMQYSCGYFKDTTELNKAQENKMDLICRKLHLKSSDRVLDIGCGWGGLAKFMAERYGCKVVGTNISDEQIKYAREFTKGLPVEIIKKDYREMTGRFDKIVSVGMFEHVGYKNYRKFMESAEKLLTDKGLFLLHTIGNNRTAPVGDPWTNKYIFPNGVLPSIKAIGSAAEKLFVIEDWHNFGQYYDPTLMAWFNNFNNNWNNIKSEEYNDRFYRMWKCYLLSFAGSFRARYIQLWQIVMSKKGIIGGYQSVR
jgi:cyclopropane-fatty-acyl-phospholipid synthase